MSKPISRRPGWVTLALSCAAILSSAPLTAQSEVFGEERRITAIDLVVAFETGAVREWATDDPSPSRPGVNDFQVVSGGQERPVIAVAPASEPWHIVIVFDTVLTGSAGLRWAADALAEVSETLVDLGEVTLLVADPTPRTLLSATRDHDRLFGALSQVARTQEGRDELGALRAKTVAEVRRDSAHILRRTLHELPEEEGRLVRSRHDDLLLHLVDAAPAAPLRALIVAGGGYDLRPEEFYRPLIAPEEEPDAQPAPETGLAEATETLAKTLAGYGWITLHLVPPEPEPTRTGSRLGKLLLTGLAVEVEEQTAIYEQYDRTVIKLFGGKLEGKRKPKRAEAYLELGTVLHAQGKYEDAEEALRQAIHHFASDPKTKERQARTFVLLGEVLEGQKETQRAMAAYDLARRLDPRTAADAAGPIAALIAPSEPLETLAQATAGGVLRSAGELGEALGGLRHRWRVTYQVAGAPDGQLYALEAEWTRSERALIYPGWARSSTPESVAAARARWLLAAGEPEGGSLDVAADLLPEAGAVDVRLDLVAGEVPEMGEDAVLRLTLGFGGPDVATRVEHRHFGPQSLAGQESWNFRASVEMASEEAWLAVLVEDLDTGLWGSRLIELP